jgi:AcrR family transcriptional regulator
MTPTTSKSEARERLLRIASELFYSEGIRAVGVERILAEADVSRATFYRHFAGKSALVQAYLDREDEYLRGLFTAATERATSPQHALELAVEAIASGLTQRPRGCPFVNAAVEFPDTDSEVRGIVKRHRDWFRDTLERILQDAGRDDAEERAAMLVLLRDAALVGRYLSPAGNTSRTFLKVARSTSGLP